MKEEDILELTDAQIRKIERVNAALAAKADAEARLESQKKMRILFERASAEALPFIVYVIYMGSVALAVLFRLLDYTGWQLVIGAILLLVVMIAPLLVLPTSGWRDLIRYLKRKITGSPVAPQ